MKTFVKTLPARHPLVSELIEAHGPEAYAYLTMLLELAHEIGPFELTPAILARECRVKNPKLSRIFPDMQTAFQKAQVVLGILNEVGQSSGKLNEVQVSSTKFNSNELSSTSEGQNPRGRNKSITREEENREEKKEENTPPTPQGASGFEEFWSLYPKKLEKGKVKEYWNRHKLDSKLPEILQGLSAWKKTDNWARDGGQYIPYPIRFLKNERWKDEIDSSGPVSAVVKPEKGSTLADRLMQHERIVDMFNPSDVLETSKLRNDGHGQLWNGNTPIAVEQYKPF